VQLHVSVGVRGVSSSFFPTMHRVDHDACIVVLAAAVGVVKRLRLLQGGFTA